eukprot:3879599-Rhodomonas_salina.1
MSVDSTLRNKHSTQAPTRTVPRNDALKPKPTHHSGEVGWKPAWCGMALTSRFWSARSRRYDSSDRGATAPIAPSSVA